MITLEQARQVLDTIISQTRMTREGHSLAAQALEMLYNAAKEDEEAEQELKELCHE